MTHATGVDVTRMADRAAGRFGAQAAQRWCSDGVWQERSFNELAGAAARVAHLLLGLGVGAGDRVALWCRTRPEWTVADLAITRIGAICVPVYPTATDEQVAWVLGDSGARAVVVEDAAILSRLAGMRDRTRVRSVLAVDDPTGDGPALREVIAGADVPELPEVDPRADDPYTIVYTSGTTGNPKGCVLTHANMAAVLAMLEEMTEVGAGDVLFAYLPLAHLLTRMLQAFCVHSGATIAYSSGDIRAIVPELGAVRPTHLPSVPTLFEKVYALVRAEAGASGRGGELDAAVELAVRVRRARERDEPVPAEDADAFAVADEQLFTLVRAAFGGRVRQALTGAAPIAKEILEFFYAAGVPIYEAYGMTESTAVISANLPGAWRVGTVGRPAPGVEVRIGADGEVLALSAGVFAGYWKNESATAETVVDGWLHTGDLGALDEDGYLSITGRKKDIVITSAGKNLAPANIENDLRRTRFVADAVMIGDRRPYPVGLLSLDPDAVSAWAADAGVDVGAASSDPRLRDAVAADVASVNARYSPPERIRDFAIVARPFSVESGELTPTLKVRRAVVAEHFADVIDSLYP